MAAMADMMPHPAGDPGAFHFRHDRVRETVNPEESVDRSRTHQ